MFNHQDRPLAAGLIAVAAASGFATPALAGQCPAARRANALANAPTMPKDVTDDVIGSDRPRRRDRRRRPPAAHCAAWSSSRAASSRSTATRIARR